jgi:hypothetical protein
MVNCKFADPKIQTEDRVFLDEETKAPVLAYGFVKCLKMSALCGFTTSVQTIQCNLCDCREPSDSKEDGLSCIESKVMSQLYKAFLKSRLIAGPLPKFDTGEQFDPKDAFRKYSEIATPTEQELLIREMFNAQRLVAVSEGGLDPVVLAQTLYEIADEHKIIPALEQAYDVLMAANQMVIDDEAQTLLEEITNG